MATPPSNAATQVANSMVPLPNGIMYQPGLTQSTNTSSQANPGQQFIGADAQPFNLFVTPGTPAQVTVTFPNLPKRATRNNPITQLFSGQNNLSVGANDYLLLDCSLMGVGQAAQATLTVKSQALTKTGVIAVGPFLGGENFVTFQAIVIASNAAISQYISGTVSAKLYLATR